MASTDSETQLPLLSPQTVYRLDNFAYASDESAHSVRQFVDAADIDFLYLYGDQGTGKSHLLLAMAEALQQSGQSVRYVSLEELRVMTPTMLSELQVVDVTCLDDLDAIVGERAWEEALFHCFNQIRARGGRLVVAALDVPSRLSLSLPDLQSRLGSGLIYGLNLQDDDLKAQALMKQAQSRGLTLADDICRYLLRRYGRDMSSLMSILNQLDKASMQAKRRLTLPFVRQVLNDVTTR